MKKIIAIVMLLMLSTAAYAQQDVTKFLGIPIDGSKSEMIKKLKAKGYTPTTYDKEALEGEFNGEKVTIHVVTNNNKVYRIMVADVNPRNERDIQIRFNTLCYQFKNNPRYITLSDFTIPDNEDISYNMSVYNKRYEASFFQAPEDIDTLDVANHIRQILLSKYTEDQIANPTEEIKNEVYEIVSDYTFDIAFKKSVWFMISEIYGSYYICMYYDNGYNQANGEDL